MTVVNAYTEIKPNVYRNFFKGVALLCSLNKCTFLLQFAGLDLNGPVRNQDFDGQQGGFGMIYALL